MLYLVKSGKITVMAELVSQSVYERAFRKKVKAATILSGIHPKEIARLLGISEDQYVRYESRYMMRADLIVPFCKIVEADLAKLMAPPKSGKKHLLESV